MTNPFEYYGLVLDNRSQLVTKCIFCSSENKFYINEQTNLWDCKNGLCLKSGNLIDFLNGLNEISKQNTTVEDYKELAKERGISWKTLQRNGLSRSILTGEWLVPQYNPNGNITNLFVYRLVGNKKRLCGTPGTDSLLYGVQNLNDSDTLFLVEGQWDYLALDYLLSLLKCRNKYNILGVPGASSFKASWLDIKTLKLTDHETVNVLFDNDGAGEKGAEKIARMYMVKKKIDVNILTWNTEDLDSGKDIRDLIKESGRDSLDQISDNLTPASTLIADLDDPLALKATVTPIECTSYKSLLKQFRTEFLTTPSMEDCFLACLATHITSRFEGKNPVWLYVVGTSSCGKSSMCELLAGANNSLSFSKLTGLHTGMEGGFEFIDRINNKCGICKDLTTMMASNKAKTDELMGELRDIYDGSSNSFYRNKKTSIKSGIRFSLIMGVTHAIKDNDMSHVGERFLRIEYDSDITDGTKISLKAMDNEINRIRGFAEKHDEASLTSRMCAGFLNHKYEELSQVQLKDLPTIDTSYQYKIANLAEIIAGLRTVVHRVGQDQDITYIPRSELGPRLSVQLQKLAIGMSFVLGEKEISEHVYNIIKKTAKDSCNEITYKVASSICDKKLSKDQISKTIGVSETTVYRKLRDLVQLNIVTVRSYKTKKAGRPVYLYQISDKFRKFWEAT